MWCCFVFFVFLFGQVALLFVFLIRFSVPYLFVCSLEYIYILCCFCLCSFFVGAGCPIALFLWLGLGGKLLYLGVFVSSAFVGSGCSIMMFVLWCALVGEGYSLH